MHTQNWTKLLLRHHNSIFFPQDSKYDGHKKYYMVLLLHTFGRYFNYSTVTWYIWSILQLQRDTFVQTRGLMHHPFPYKMILFSFGYKFYFLLANFVMSLRINQV